MEQRKNVVQFLPESGANYASAQFYDANLSSGREVSLSNNGIVKGKSEKPTQEKEDKGTNIASRYPFPR